MSAPYPNGWRQRCSRRRWQRLDSSGAAVYRVQAELRDRLVAAVAKRNPELAKGQSGFNAVFSSAFPHVNDDDRQLHSLIRGYTIYGLKPLNDSMIHWLQADTEFKVARTRRSVDVTLARQLGALEAHLLMWIAKYSAWIPDTPAHALVYLADEESHGVPFPTGLEHTIEQALGVTGEAG
jgi:hypothetical protein